MSAISSPFYQFHDIKPPKTTLPLNRLHHGMGPGPLPGSGNGSLFVLLPSLGDIICERVVRVWRSKQGLDRQQDGTDLESRGPVGCE